MSQKQRLLEYLQTNKVIYPLESWPKLGIYRLSDVILKLRKDGYQIETHLIKVKNRFGEHVKFGVYELMESEK